MEVFLDLVVGRQKEFGRFGADFLGYTFEVVAGFLEIENLVVQEVVPFLGLGELLNSHEVNAAKVPEFLTGPRQFFPKLSRGRRYREHALLEFEKFAGMGVAEILLDVLYLGFRGGKVHMIFFKLGLYLAHVGYQVLQSFLFACNVAVPGGNFIFQCFQILGKRFTPVLDRRQFAFNLGDLFVNILEAFLLRENFVFHVAKRTFL